MPKTHPGHPSPPAEGRPAPTLPEVAPLDVDGVRTVVVGTIAWAVVLVALLISRPWLGAADRWWTWVGVAGVALGLFGIGYCVRRRRRLARAVAGT